MAADDWGSHYWKENEHDTVNFNRFAPTYPTNFNKTGEPNMGGN